MVKFFIVTRKDSDELQLSLLSCTLVYVYMYRDVAQFGSAFALGAKGRRFKSYHPENVFSSGVERRFPKPNVVGSNPTRRVP